MNRPSDYKAIMAWGIHMGSLPDYIRYQQEQAAAANAPLDAIFQNGSVTSDGSAPFSWARASEIAEAGLRNRILLASKPEPPEEAID